MLMLFVCFDRHYTFYVWRLVFLKHWALRYALVPVYLVLIGLWAAHFRASAVRPISAIGFLVAAALCLVPSPLVEPRYFVVPFFFLTIVAEPPALGYSVARALPVLVLEVVTNAVTLYVFVARPFVSSDWGPGSRFMW